MNYNWIGINDKKTPLQGIIEATNITTASKKLHQLHQQLLLLKVIPQRKSFFTNITLIALLANSRKKIKTTTIANFMQQFAFLINANIPLTTSLDVISKDNSNIRFKKLIKQIQNDIENGMPLSLSLQHYSKYFPKLWCNLISTGEQSGTLPTILNHIAQHINKTLKQKHKIIKALSYPCIVTIIAIIVTSIMLVFVIPRFQEMFNNFSSTLPLYTQYIITIANLVKNYGVYFILFCLISSIGFLIAKKYSVNLNHQLEKLMLNLPIVGNILHKHCCIQFAQILYTTTKAGIPLCDALNITSHNIENYIYQKSILRVRKSVINGNSLHNAMHQQKLFNEQVLQLVDVGEESGKLENIFATIANHYEEELNHIIDNLNNLLEPALMLILGIIIGSLVIGMYLPIFRLGNII